MNVLEPTNYKTIKITVSQCKKFNGTNFGTNTDIIDHDELVVLENEELLLVT